MLSKSEQAVGDMLVTGLSNKEIADRLFVTEKTVKFHLTNIYRKMGVHSRAEYIVKFKGECDSRKMSEEIFQSYQPPTINGEIMLESGSKPIERVMLEPDPRPLDQGARQVQVLKKSQEDKITFIDQQFKVGDTITQLHSMMKEVTSKELTPNTVNAACNCVARLNETINTAIQAARFLNER